MSRLRDNGLSMIEPDRTLRLLEPPNGALFDRVPAHANKLWKYLSFAKLVLLLNRRTLHCARVDQFEDRIEGRWPRADLDYLRNPASRHSPAELAEARRHVAASCWVESENESAAMWPLYGGQTAESVAIVTRFAKLAACAACRAAAARDEEWYAGAVRYLDFRRDEGVLRSDDGEKPSFLKVFTLKHSSYAHENEVRAVGVNFARAIPRQGAEIAIDPVSFIEEIVVHPRAERWFFDLVSDAAAAHGLNACVRRSEISDLESEDLD
jgi:hypothetical protein